jgi:hypothetical protein
MAFAENLIPVATFPAQNATAWRKDARKLMEDGAMRQLSTMRRGQRMTYFALRVVLKRLPA